MKTFQELRENIISDYNDLKAKGKSDSAALDILLSMSKYRKMNRDQMAKKIGDAKRKGVFKR